MVNLPTGRQLGAWEEHWMQDEDLGPSPGSAVWSDPEQVTYWYGLPLSSSGMSGIDPMNSEASYSSVL